MRCVVLGISAFYHDSAAALVEDGRIVAAAQEERFTRKKHDAAFPHKRHRLLPGRSEGHGSTSSTMSSSTTSHSSSSNGCWKPISRLRRAAFARSGWRCRSGCAKNCFRRALLRDELKKLSPNRLGQNRLLFCEHHLSHAASAFLSLAVRGRGRAHAWTASANGRRRRPRSATATTSQIIKEIHFPHSLGLLYSAFTYYTGFKVNSGEYKLMGLAPYGEPRYANSSSTI